MLLISPILAIVTLMMPVVYELKGVKYRKSTIALSDGFLQNKVAPLVADAAARQGTPKDVFVAVNKKLRKENEDRITAITRATSDSIAAWLAIGLLACEQSQDPGSPVGSAQTRLRPVEAASPGRRQTAPALVGVVAALATATQTWADQDPAGAAASVAGACAILGARAAVAAAIVALRERFDGDIRLGPGERILEAQQVVGAIGVPEASAAILRAPPVYGPGDKALLPYFRLVKRRLAPAPAQE